MEKYLVISILLIITPLFALGQHIDGHGMESITAQEMKDHVDYIASDAMRGRNTPSPELDSCAAYIAGEFASAGLSPIDKDSGFYQSFNVVKVRLAVPNSLQLTTRKGPSSYTIKRDFVPIKSSGNGRVSGSLVFVGYGITASELEYDDYENIDTRGKIVFMMTGEPQEKDPASPFSGTNRTEYSRIEYKIQNAQDHGAAGILLVSNPNRRFRRPPNRWPSLLQNAPSIAVPLTLEASPDQSLACIHISKELANNLFNLLDTSLEAVHDSINTDLKPRSFPLPEVMADLEVQLHTERFLTQNVVGIWRGIDPELRNEYIVIGAHYDHVGVKDDTLVYNGADDNASGTAGVIEIAEAFTQSATLPKRTVVFMTFAAEEKGLYGSRYYTDNPIVPIEQTVAMLNMDMISRNDTLDVNIIGAQSSTDFQSLIAQANSSIGMNIFHTQQHFMQSHHYPFYLKDIPVLLFSSGDTEDLHRPTDDPEKSIPEKMSNIARLAFGTVWLIANQTHRLKFTKVD